MMINPNVISQAVPCIRLKRKVRHNYAKQELKSVLENQQLTGTILAADTNPIA